MFERVKQQFWRRRVAVAFCAVAALAFWAWPGRFHASRVSERTNQELIDALEDVSQDSLGSLAGFKDFVLDNQYSAEDTLEISPVVRELVRRGPAALPDLLAHLEDARLTRSAGHTGFGGMWYGDYYDPRYPDRDRAPVGVNTQFRANVDSPDRKYRLRVGDACFVIVGLIVNRRLVAFQSIPTGCAQINSPVKSRALAFAARADWRGLTQEQHQASLIEDARTSYTHRDSAIARLRFFYPETAKRIESELDPPDLP